MKKHFVAGLTSSVVILFIQWYTLTSGLKHMKLFEENRQIFATNRTNPTIAGNSTAKPHIETIQNIVGVYDDELDNNKTNGIEIARDIEFMRNTSQNTSEKAFNQSLKCKCLDCNIDNICGGLWRAYKFPILDNRDPRVAKTIHLIVSHCKSDLHWVTNYTQGYNIASIHIVTKCGKEVVGAPENAIITALPNVGRCDHTYAFYISHVLDGVIERHGSEKDSIIVFLKDDMRRANYHQGEGGWLKFKRMVILASSKNGFACGGQIAKQINSKMSMSVFYCPKELFKYRLNSYRYNKHGYDMETSQKFKSNYTNLGEFYKYIVDDAPEPQLCSTVCLP